MRNKLVLLLLAAGLFASLEGARKYVSSINETEAKSLIKVLEKKDLKKSPKVALATGPHKSKKIKSLLGDDESEQS